jgi:diacylglycerol kinase family enzyme
LGIHVYYNCPIATIYQHATLIYNPAAGGLSRSRAERLRRAMDVLKAAGHSVSVIPTPEPATAGAIAKRAIEQGADLIVAAGGDGTINEVANGMIGSAVPLAVLPGGTANVLARELRLSLRLPEAAAQIAQLRPQRISAGLLHAEGGVRRYFLLMAGAGFDAHIVYNLNLNLKSRLRQGAYFAAGFRELFRSLDELDVLANGASRRCSFALASRTRNYAGYFQIAGGASLLNHDFEVCLFEGTSPFRYLTGYLAAALAHRVARMKGISVLRAPEMEFRPLGDPHVYVQVDGEYAGRLPARIETVRDALTLLVPPEFFR